MSHDDKLELLWKQKNLALEAKELARLRRNRAKRRLSHMEEIIDRGVDDVPLLYLPEAKAKLSWAEEGCSDAYTSHEQAKKEFVQARERFDGAERAFHREIARRAGIGSQYLDSDSFKVSGNKDGLYDIYFGGASSKDSRGRYVVKPDDGHGHYVVEVTPVFRVAWWRDPDPPA